MNEGVAYWAPPDENPNFISRPPDPGISALFKTVGWEALYHSPFYATKRFSELTLESSSHFNVAGRILDPAEATEKYGLGGQLKFDEPIKEEAAQLMYRRKRDEIDRSYLISSGSTTGFRQAGSFAVGMAATLIDPINFASMFIPVVGEARIARFAKQFTGVASQRLARGALMGATGAAMVEPFILLPALQEQANYDLRDSAINLGFGAALGGFLHAGLGAVADRLKRLRPKDADAIFESALNNALKDEPITSPAKVAEFVDELNPERVIGAAYKLEDGTILTGKSHPEIIRDALEDPIKAAGIHGKSVDGFVTDSGRFISREEASRVAEAAGQVRIGYADGGNKPGVSPMPLGSDDIRASNEGPNSRELLLDANIPKRDSRGRFIKKEDRLRMLDEKIRNEIQENGSQKVIEDTKENSSRGPKNDLWMTGDHAKDITILEQDIQEIEKALDLTPEEKERLVADIKEEAGDQPGRAAGIVEGIKCIIKNLH
jgi:hypothetical protein